MSEFRERQQLGGLSMRKVSFYMEYIARTRSDDRTSVTRSASRRPERERTVSSARDITRAGIPDPWDVVDPSTRPMENTRPMGNVRPMDTGRARAVSAAPPISFYDDVPDMRMPPAQTSTSRAVPVQAPPVYEPPVYEDESHFPYGADGIPAQPDERGEVIDLDAPINWEATYDSDTLNIRAPSLGNIEEPPPASPSPVEEWNFGAGRWADFVSAGTEADAPIEEPEGMRLDSSDTEDDVLTEAELRRAMAFLNDDAFLMTGVSASESARRSIEATSKIKPLTPDMLTFGMPEEASAPPSPPSAPASPAFDADEPFEIYDEETPHTGRRVSSVNFPDDEPELNTSRRAERGGSGLRALIWVLLALFILSVGAMAYLWFFTDFLPFKIPVVDAYQVSLDSEPIGCVMDGSAVQAAVEEERKRVQDQNGLPAEHSLPITLEKIRLEKRFVATEDEMIEYIRRRSAILVEAAGIKDIRTKALRSNNPCNVVSATMNGLRNLRTAEQAAETRGKSAKDILG